MLFHVNDTWQSPQEHIEWVDGSDGDGNGSSIDHCTSCFWRVVLYEIVCIYSFNQNQPQKHFVQRQLFTVDGISSLYCTVWDWEDDISLIRGTCTTYINLCVYAQMNRTWHPCETDDGQKGQQRNATMYGNVLTKCGCAARETRLWHITIFVTDFYFM